ncbi:hypothetical protein [Streptomyces cavernicola]|uniref:Uncharacterized protein n=1 Tax=Streptomyces cavernicola TaxID=3043613 RepID=A0ABT6SMP5_9ACTN|nr:hypothetical protein [Streptomyces sp. B-S-A6]MDI3409458.1 hypothetical protein [Streptomyces sp. B-S-A6]
MRDAMRRDLGVTAEGGHAADDRRPEPASSSDPSGFLSDFAEPDDDPNS